MSAENEYVEAQDTLEERRQARDAGISQATATGYDQAEINQNKEFFESYSDPGISPDPPASGLEKSLGPELSHHHLFGNIDRVEFEKLKLENAVLAMRKKAEHPRTAGVSSKCTGSRRRKIVGEDDVELTPERARKIDSTIGPRSVRSQMQSQSIEASAWKGITTMKSVVKTMGGKAKEASSGVLGRAKQFLFGGGNS